MNKNKIITALLFAGFSAGAHSATLNFDGVTEAATLYNFSGLEFEYFVNDDGTEDLFSKQVFVDGAVSIPHTNWRVGILAASFQTHPDSGSTVHGKDVEIKPTYEKAINDHLNLGNEFGYGAGDFGDAFWTKPFLFNQWDNGASIYSETLWKLEAGGRSGLNENVVHPMYAINDNWTVGLEMFYAQGLKESTFTELAVRPNFSYTFDGNKMLWGKMEIGQVGDQDDNQIEKDYIKYAIGYNMKLNDVFGLVTEASVYSWDEDYRSQSGNNYFIKVGLAY